MDQFGGKIKHITAELKDYVETRIELSVIKVSEKSTWLAGKGIQKLVGFSIFSFGMIFVLFATAIWIGNLLDSEYLGYLIVAAPLLIIGGFLGFSSSESLAKRIHYDLMDEVMEEFDKNSKGRISEAPKQIEERKVSE